MIITHDVRFTRDDKCSPMHVCCCDVVRTYSTGARMDSACADNCHFQDYQEGIKFQYLFKLIFGYADLSHEALMNYYTSHQADLADISSLMNAHRTDKCELNKLLDLLAKDASKMIDRIDTLTMQLLEGVEDGPKAN